MKDNFSTQSENYAKYRPTYPVAFYDFALSLVKDKQRMWDCGTGNGQVAYQLSKYFEQVCATDISTQQLANAMPNHNITYSLQAAEKTDFPDQSFDLIVVAQAIHWFQFDQFYQEVNRTLKEDGVLVVLGYGLHRISTEIDAIIDHFYFHIVGSYWDAERKYIDEHYQTLPFPFAEIPSPALENSFDWTLEHLIGYLETWSAVKHFRKEKGYNPLDDIRSALKQQWGSDVTKKVTFPLLLRVGKK